MTWRRLLEWLIPADALVWDWDRPFAEDPHIWRDRRVMAALRYQVRDLFPIVRTKRGEILYQFSSPFGDA